jgi:hypothetical protein
VSSEASTGHARFMPGPPLMTEQERYANAWRDLRRRETVSAFLFLLCFSWIARELAHPPFKKNIFLLFLLCISVAAIAWQLSFRCPRCGNLFLISRFSRYPAAKRCVHCQLRRGDSSVVFKLIFTVLIGLVAGVIYGYIATRYHLWLPPDWLSS